MFNQNLTRRASIGGLFALAAVSAAAITRVTSLHAEDLSPNATATSAVIQPSDRWLNGLNGKHKQLFDAPTPNGGIALVHAMNYYDTYNSAYKVKDSDIDAVMTFYGATTFYGLNDHAWAKYRLGEFLETNDAATNRPAVVNPWRASPVVLGMALPAASIESLNKRGATFILCNNALQIFAGMLASKRGLDATVVYNDLKANILPGVELVPAMVIAVEQATRAGVSYHRQ